MGSNVVFIVDKGGKDAWEKRTIKGTILQLVVFDNLRSTRSLVMHNARAEPPRLGIDADRKRSTRYRSIDRSTRLDLGSIPNLGNRPVFATLFFILFFVPHIYVADEAGVTVSQTFLV